VNLRPNQPQRVEEKQREVQGAKENPVKEEHVKTSITLSRHLAVRAKKYVSEQQLNYAQGQRQSNYSFSQLYTDALNFYLDYLEKGDSHEKDS
jgi:hypothetical protein